MGGSGERFKARMPKQFHQLGDRPLYQWTLDAFLTSQLFEEIILVTHPDWCSKVEQEIAQNDQVRVTVAGPTRQSSSLAGLFAAGSDTKIVVIHDAVRPFVTHRILKENIETALKIGAADTCILSTDTLVHAPEKDKIASIPPRHEYMRGQTPQSFSYPLIVEAHQKTKETEASDDCQLVHFLGHEIAIVKGEESNLKVTTEWDLLFAEALLKNMSALQST